MSDRERTDAGTFVETVTLDAVVSVFEEVRGPVITSSDVSEALDCSTESARQKLTQLYEEGRVDKRKTGRTTVWWHTGGEPITPDERAVEEDAEAAREQADKRREERGESRPEATDQSATPTATQSAGDEQKIDGDTVDAVATEWSDPPERIEARKEAARAVLAYAREHGTVSKQEAKEEVFPEYSVEGQNARTWYRKNIRPVLNEAAEYDQSARAYRLVDDTEEDADPLDTAGPYDPTEEFES